LIDLCDRLDRISEDQADQHFQIKELRLQGAETKDEVINISRDTEGLLFKMENLKEKMDRLWVLMAREEKGEEEKEVVFEEMDLLDVMMSFNMPNPKEKEEKKKKRRKKKLDWAPRRSTRIPKKKNY